jgi:hypothetical protein
VELRPAARADHRRYRYSCGIGSTRHADLAGASGSRDCDARAGRYRNPNLSALPGSPRSFDDCRAFAASVSAVAAASLKGRNRGPRAGPRRGRIAGGSARGATAPPRGCYPAARFDLHGVKRSIRPGSPRGFSTRRPSRNDDLWRRPPRLIYLRCFLPLPGTRLCCSRRQFGVA